MPFSNFFKKTAVSRLSLSPASRFNFFFFLRVLLLLLQSSSFICFFNLLHSLLLQSSSCAPPRFHLLHCCWRFCFLASSSRFCVGQWVWFFFAFLLHLRHSVSSSRYVSPSRCFFFLHCYRRWLKPPLGSCWAVYGSPDP